MVLLPTTDEIRERIESEKAPPPQTFSALDYTKAIASTLALDGNSIGNLIKDGRVGWLKATSNMSPEQLALTISTLVIFSAVGNAKPTKSGAISFAKSKGNTITESFRQKVERAVEEYNKQDRATQLDGIQKIRQSSVDALVDLRRNTTRRADQVALDIEINEARTKLNESILEKQANDLNKLDRYIQFKVEKGVIVRDKPTELQNKVDDMNAEGGYLGKYKYKVENGEIVIDRPKADPEVIKTNEAITEENLRIAEESIRKMKEAEEKAKAEDKKIDEDPDFDEKGTPDGGDEVIETREKLTDEDKPDFSDTKDTGVRDEPVEEMIDRTIESNRQEEEATETIKKVSGAGAGAVITTEIVEKLTRGEDDETRRRRNFELDDEPGFTEEPVKEGEEGTQATTTPTPAPTPAPTPEQANITFINHKEKRTQTTENIDILFSITIDACDKAYDDTIGFQRNYFYFSKFNVPFLLFITRRTLFIAFRGTASVSNVLTDMTTADIPFFKNNNNSNFLYDHQPFNSILDPVASNIEFHLGIILRLKESYPFIIEKIKDLDHLINSIVVTGHSLGGAMAQLFTYVYNNSNEDKYNKIPIKHLVTYGQPRILIDKPEYIKLFDNSVEGYHRVWNTLDPVAYVPFKKKVTIDNMMGSNILSGYTHVGNSFNLSGNIVNNDVDLILYEILKGNKEKIEMLLDKKDLLTNSKLLKFMLSDKYLSLQLYTFYKCLEEVEVKEEITQEQLTFLTNELQKDTSNLLNYAEKCDLVKPWGIADILKMNPLTDDVDEQNFTIDCIAGCSISSNKVTSKAHKLEYYHSLLDDLIARQINDKKPIFEVIDKVDFYERKVNLFDGVIGMTTGEFNNGDVVSF
jgi:hypothetical protein